MKFITSLLEKKVSTILCIFIAVACRVINLLFGAFYGNDKMWQLLQSKSFLNGKGLGIPKYFVSQLDHPVYDYTPRWPPGYPLIISPFLKLFNYDIFLATGVLETIICIAFIFLVRKICKQMSFPPAAVNLMTIIAGCFGYPFISLDNATDNISLFFFLLGISCLFQTIRSNRFSILLQLLCGFLLFLPSFLRYGYIPVVACIPGVVIIFGMYLKDKSIVLKGAYTLGVLIILQATMLILLNKFTGLATHIYPTEKGYYWENLIHWFQVVPGSFMSFPFFITQIFKNTPLSVQNIVLLFDITNVLGLIIISYFLYVFFRERKFSSAPDYKWYIVFGISSCAMLCLTLGYLSFRYKAQHWFNIQWNYIGEPRYFSFFILFVQFLFIGWLFLNNSWKKSIWQKTVVIICSIVMFIEISHSIYFNTKIAFNFKRYQYDYRSADYTYFDSLLTSISKEHPDYEILVACQENEFYPCLASYRDKKGIFDPLVLNDILPKVKVKSFLIVSIWPGNKDSYRNFLANKNVRKINSSTSSGFYLLELYTQK